MLLRPRRALWEACGAELGPYKSHKKTDDRTAAYAHIEDILAASKKLDAADKLPEAVAKYLDKLLDRKPEEIN